MLIDLQDKIPTERYHLMTDVITPRPIAWVATENGVVNLAPFSYFTPISSEPPTVVISIGHRPDGRPKDTLHNLRAHGRCSISILEADHLSLMTASAEPLESDISEIEELNIPMERILEDYPPMPAGIKAAFFGTYLQEVDLKGSSTVPVIITLEHLYIDEQIISDPDKLKLSFDPVARMGGTYRELGANLSEENKS